jgi:hypothetical protein
MNERQRKFCVILIITNGIFYGIRGIAGKWFKSYLNRRRQKVEIKSTPIPIKIPIQNGALQTIESHKIGYLAPYFFS